MTNSTDNVDLLIAKITTAFQTVGPIVSDVTMMSVRLDAINHFTTCLLFLFVGAVMVYVGANERVKIHQDMKKNPRYNSARENSYFFYTTISLAGLPVVVITLYALLRIEYIVGVFYPEYLLAYQIMEKIL